MKKVPTSVSIIITVSMLAFCQRVALSDGIPKGKERQHRFDEFKYQEQARDGATYVFGTIHGPVVWARAGSPYVVAENLFVASDGQLTIEPGVLVKVVHPPGAQIYSDEGVHLSVRGTLIARGTPDAMIRFTSASPKPQKGTEWDGISLSGSKPCILEWAIVEYPRFGVDCGGATLIAHCIFRNCHTGIWLNERFIGDVVHNVSAYNIYSGIRCRGTPAEATIRNNIFYKNGDGIDAWAGAFAYADYNLYWSGQQSRGSNYGDSNYRGMSPGPHDVVADPEFLDPENGDFRLSQNSPARCAGYHKVDIGLAADAWLKPSADQEVEKWLAKGARALWYEGWRAQYFGGGDARGCYEKALKLSMDPELKVRTLCSLGSVLTSEKQYDQARSVLRRALVASRLPHLRDMARRHLAELAARSGNPAGALAVLERVEWAQSKVWREPAQARYAAMAGDTQAVFRLLSRFKGDPYRYVETLDGIISEIIADKQLDTALKLMGGFDAYPMCMEVSGARLRLAEAFRERGNFDTAADLLRRSVDADPFSREAPESLALLADILEADLGRVEEAKAMRIRLATNYYPDDPWVVKARAALDSSALTIPRNKAILLDASLQESSIFDRGPTGSCNFGQYEVIGILSQAGFVVHANDCVRPCPGLTPDIIARYGLIVLNGRYGGGDQPPIPQALIENLVNYANEGGSLLVVAGGHVLGSGREAQFYNPLVSRFGLRFEEGTTVDYSDGKPADHPVVKELGGFYAMHGVRTQGGEVLGHCGQTPVIALVRYGKGKVAIAGLGSGFMGQVMDVIDKRGAKKARTNEKLLVELASYLLSTGD